jgi:hypothetical protein
LGSAVFEVEAFDGALFQMRTVFTVFAILFWLTSSCMAVPMNNDLCDDTCNNWEFGQLAPIEQPAEKLDYPIPGEMVHHHAPSKTRACKKQINSADLLWLRAFWVRMGVLTWVARSVGSSCFC